MISPATPAPAAAWPLALRLLLARLLPSACAVVALTASAAPDPTPPAQGAGAGAPFALHELAPGVFAAVDGPAHASGSNAGFVIGDDGVLVVDSFFSPDAARALVSAIRVRTTKPIRYVVNTHYHIDHVAGDAVMRAQGAVVLAHRNARAWMRTENLRLFGPALTDVRRRAIESLTLPDVGITGASTIWLGQRRVEIEALEGHTGGDLIVRIPDAGVVFCGDLLWRKIPPNMIDGTTTEWLSALGDLSAIRAPGAADGAPGNVRYVPGHGEVADRADVLEARGYLEAVRSAVAAARAHGLEGRPLAEAALDTLRPRYGAWTGFAVMAPAEIPLMEAELAGAKVRPRPSAQ